MNRPPSIAWHSRALCYGDDPDLYDEVFVDPRALAVCHKCPVQVQCLEWALITDERYGIYAGTHPDQRRKLIQRSRDRDITEVVTEFLASGQIPTRRKRGRPTKTP